MILSTAMKCKILWECDALPDIEIIMECSERDIALLRFFENYDCDLTCACHGNRCSGGYNCMACETGLYDYKFAPFPFDVPEVNRTWGEELIYHLSELDVPDNMNV